MSQAFDPYRLWLGIPKDEPRPLSYYRLLGVEKFESDPVVISNSADRQIHHLRNYSTSEHGGQAEQLINELIKAKRTLLNPERRAAYDQKLRGSAVPPGNPRASAPQAAPAPVSRSQNFIARPAAAPADTSRVALASDPAHWDLDSLVSMPVPVEVLAPSPAPVEPSALAMHGMAETARPEALASPTPPLATRPVAVPPVCLPNQPLEPKGMTQPPVSYHAVPPQVIPVPVANHDAPVAPPMPPLYHSYQPTLPGAGTSHAPPLAAHPTAELDDRRSILAALAEAERHRRVYRLAAVCFALALVILGTFVSIVIAIYGLNPNDAEQIANNVPQPAPSPAPLAPASPAVQARLPREDEPEQSLPAAVLKLPTPNLPAKAIEPAASPAPLAEPVEAPIQIDKLKFNAAFEWPPVENPLVPQLVRYWDLNALPLEIYRYPATNPRMATVMSRSHEAGDWAIENDELTYEAPASADEFLLFGDPTWTDYTVEFEVATDRTNSMHPVGVLFRTADDSEFQIFQDAKDFAQLQTWQARVTTLGIIKEDSGDPIKPAPTKFAAANAWKKYRIAVNGSRIVAERDAQVLFDKLASLKKAGRPGLKFEPFEDGKVRLRNLRVVAPDKRVLWQGLPELPPSLSRTKTRLWPRANLNAWKELSRPVVQGRWHILREADSYNLLQAIGSEQPPTLATQEYNYTNYFLEVRFRKVRGEFDLLVQVPDNYVAADHLGTRFHLSYASPPAAPAKAEHPLFLQFTKASDGYQLRLNGETVLQRKDGIHPIPQRGRIGFHVAQPDAEIVIEEIMVRRAPDNFRLYDQQFQTNPDRLVQRGIGPGWEIVMDPALTRNIPFRVAGKELPANPSPVNKPEQPLVVAAAPAPPQQAQPAPQQAVAQQPEPQQPPPQQPAPQQPAANPAPALPAPVNQPPRNPLADIVAKFGLDPNAGQPMPAAENPDLMPRLTPLAELARKDEDMQKLLDEIEKARAAYHAKLKQIDEEYLKAFDAEVTRIRSSFKYNANERAALLEPLLEDKKAYAARRRFSLAHCMLPHNYTISLILAERQKFDRVFEQTMERLFKDKKDEAAVEVSKARRQDPDLAPLPVFEILYLHTNLGTPRSYEFFGDKTINGNPKMTWAIDADKRLILSGPIQYVETNTIEALQISIDGRKLINLKAIPGSNAKTGIVVTD